MKIHLLIADMARTILVCSFILCSAFPCLAQIDKYQFPKIHPGPFYGRNCGLVGVDPYERVTIETLIHYRDTATIALWLDNDKAEIQAYAIEAIIRLQEIGAIAPSFHQIEINAILKKNPEVHVCSGCSHWPTILKDALRPGISINKIRVDN